MSTPQTIADLINRYDPLTGDLRRPTAEPPAVALHEFLIAVDNLERARARRASAEGAEVIPSSSHLLGCINRFRDARRTAEDSLASLAK